MTTNTVKKVMTETGWKIWMNAAKEFLTFFKFAKPLVDLKIGLQPLIGDMIHDPNESVRAAMFTNFWLVICIHVRLDKSTRPLGNGYAEQN